jgi:riboflavin kinase/FMN adenylyltransferase
VLVIRDSDVPATDQPSVVAIGVFDGVHLGHQKVIRGARALADEQSARAVVVTFDPHPAWILAPRRAPNSIATIGQRVEVLERLGVDVVRILTFKAELAHESAIDFIDRVLVAELHAVQVVVGRDFRFGHDREGDVELLKSEGADKGFGVMAAPIYGAATRWSSTVVRESLTDGNLELANATLGRPFTLRGVVEHGDARGADLGFPTANLGLADHQQLPLLGIYAGAAHLADGSWWPAAISVGTRPQFYEDGALLVEVHLVNYRGDLYDTELDVAFLQRLRGEMTFASVAELVVQMSADVEQTVDIFNKFSPDAFPLLG